MTILKGKKQIKTVGDYLQEIYAVAGVDGFPVSLQVSSEGTLLAVSIGQEEKGDDREGVFWKVGGTTPIEEEVEVEKTIVVDGVEETIHTTETVVTGYEENFVEKSLTKSQIDKLNEWISENIENK